VDRQQSFDGLVIGIRNGRRHQAALGYHNGHNGGEIGAACTEEGDSQRSYAELHKRIAKPHIAMGRAENGVVNHEAAPHDKDETPNEHRDELTPGIEPGVQPEAIAKALWPKLARKSRLRLRMQLAHRAAMDGIVPGMNDD